MTDEEALEIYNSMVLEYGDRLPDFEHYPIQFKYYYKLFKMNPRLKQLAKQAQVEHCISHVRLQEFADLIIKDVIDEIGNANAQHCAITTHDLGTVNCVDAKITNHLLRTFDIKQQFGVT